MRAVRIIHGFTGMLNVATVLGLLAVLCLTQACSSKTEEERLAEAQKALEERNIIGAELMLKDFLEKFPDSPNAMRARFDLSQAYFMDKDFVKCRELLDEIVSLAGGLNTQTGLNAATLKLDTFLAENRPDLALEDAIKTSASLTSVEPEFLQFRQYHSLKTAELFNRNNLTTESLAVCQSILNQQASPTVHLDAMRIMSTSYMRDKRIPEFIKSHLDYIEANPQSELNMLLKLEVAQALDQDGRPEESEKYYDEVEAEIQRTLDATVGADEKLQIVFQLAQIKEARRKPEEAQELLRNIIAEFPMSQQRPNAMRALAESYFRVGKKAEGNSILDEIAATYPNTPHAVQAVRRKQEFAAAELKAADVATTGTEPAATPAVVTTDAPTTAPAATDEPAPQPAQ